MPLLYDINAKNAFILNLPYVPTEDINIMITGNDNATYCGTIKKNGTVVANNTIPVGECICIMCAYQGSQQ